MAGDIPPPVRGTQRGRRTPPKRANPLLGQARSLLSGLGIEIGKDSLGDLLIAAGHAVNQYKELNEARQRKTRKQDEDEEDDEDEE